MKKAMYFNAVYDETNPPAGAICITYDPNAGFQCVEGRKTITIMSETDKNQNDTLKVLEEKVATLEKTITVMIDNEGGVIETDTTITVTTAVENGI